MIDNVSKFIARFTGFASRMISTFKSPHSEVDDVRYLQVLNEIKTTGLEDAINEITHLRQQQVDKSWLNDWSCQNLPEGTMVTDKMAHKIAHHARHSTSPTLNAVILRKIAIRINARAILELGTSTGISSAYLVLERNTKLDTIERDPEIVYAAQCLHQQLNIDSVNYHTGDFDIVLKQLLKTRLHYDLVFIDGDHRYERTIHYFNTLLPYCADNAIIILDDIYWSFGMIKAWKILRDHPRVQWSIDTYHTGIIRLRPSGITSRPVHRYCMPDQWMNWLFRRRKKKGEID